MYYFIMRVMLTDVKKCVNLKIYLYELRLVVCFFLGESPFSKEINELGTLGTRSNN